jgi:hypothetical protein
MNIAKKEPLDPIAFRYTCACIRAEKRGRIRITNYNTRAAPELRVDSTANNQPEEDFGRLGVRDGQCQRQIGR